MQDGSETKLSAPKLIKELSWNGRCLVAWGGLRPGGVVTVHLPKEVYQYETTWGANCNCMPTAGISLTWTFHFGYLEWKGAILCRRCFHHEKSLPKVRAMPEGGWWAYVRKPADERILLNGIPNEELRRETVVKKILNIHFKPDGDELDDNTHSRIVEI